MYLNEKLTTRVYNNLRDEPSSSPISVIIFSHTLAEPRLRFLRSSMLSALDI